MKVNEEVFERAAALRRAGIATFVGVPIVHSLFELGQRFDCVWFSLQPSEQFHAEVEVECEPRVNLGNNRTLMGPCSSQEICQIVRSESLSKNWNDVAETLRSIRLERHSVYGAVYKPIFFAVW